MCKYFFIFFFTPETGAKEQKRKTSVIEVFPIYTFSNHSVQYGSTGSVI